MGPSNIRFLSFRAIFHFPDYGRKGVFSTFHFPGIFAEVHLAEKKHVARWRIRQLVVEFIRVHMSMWVTNVALVAK